MRVLLDTHILLWWLMDAPQLTAAQRQAIADPQNRVYVSAVSVAEIAIKASLGKLVAPSDILGAVRQSGLTLISFKPEQAVLIRDLPWIHRDPFDRMLIAQALSEGMRLVTADEAIRQYEVPVL